MGWGNCGIDSQGRMIGYSFTAICDHPDCEKVIDRGLAYVCGDMHGEDIYSCEKYYCDDHRRVYVEDNESDICYLVCDDCEEGFKDVHSGMEWDDMEGCWRPEGSKSCGCKEDCPMECKGECGCKNCRRKWAMFQATRG